MIVDAMAWKRAVTSLHALEDGGAAPTLTPPVGADPLFEHVAHAAAASLKTHPEVASVQVIIHGTERRPRVQLECVLTPAGDVARMADLIDSSVLSPLEMLLGAEFAAVDVRIQHSAGRPAACTAR